MPYFLHRQLPGHKINFLMSELFFVRVVPRTALRGRELVEAEIGATSVAEEVAPATVPEEAMAEA